MIENVIWEICDLNFEQLILGCDDQIFTGKTRQYSLTHLDVQAALLVLAGAGGFPGGEGARHEEPAHFPVADVHLRDGLQRCVGWRGKQKAGFFCKMFTNFFVKNSETLCSSISSGVISWCASARCSSCSFPHIFAQPRAWFDFRMLVHFDFGFVKTYVCF